LLIEYCSIFIFIFQESHLHSKTTLSTLLGLPLQALASLPLFWAKRGPLFSHAHGLFLKALNYYFFLEIHLNKITKFIFKFVFE
jgi:hypothetical protein